MILSPESKVYTDIHIRVNATHIQVGGKTIEVHYYSRYIQDDTELWFFGSGLGDQAIMTQMGDSFLSYVEKHGDPKLGRIMIQCGASQTAYIPYKGDFNVYYAWGRGEDWLNYYLEHSPIKATLFLCPSKTMLKQVEDQGLKGVFFPAAVGRFFKPLNLTREGFGYSGIEGKPKQQLDIVLAPFLNNPVFEWRAKTIHDTFLSLDELNKWYNTKKVLFGMANQYNILFEMASNRIFETLASGSPYVCYRQKGLSEALGFNYPYQTSSREETVSIVNEMLDDYESTLKEFLTYSKKVIENQSYENRLKQLFMELKKL